VFELAATRFLISEATGEVTVLQQAIADLQRRLTMEPPLTASEAFQAIRICSQAREFDLARAFVRQQSQVDGHDPGKCLEQLCQVELEDENFVKAIRIADEAIRDRLDSGWAASKRAEAMRRLWTLVTER
jgi:tetratricopeptide (TPR) repeat protein